MCEVLVWCHRVFELLAEENVNKYIMYKQFIITFLSFNKIYFRAAK